MRKEAKIILYNILVLLATTIPQSDAANSYQVVATTNQKITEHGICKIVTNSTAQDLFVPTRTGAEWSAFRTNPPTGVTVGDCVAGYVNSTTAGAATGNLTINVPSGTQADHVMVATVSVRPDTTTITTPTGWNLIRSTTQGAATASRMSTYYRVSPGGEPASYTWTFGGSASTGAAGGIITFSGLDTTTPVNVENGQATASSLTHATPSITTTVTNSMLVGSFQYTSVTNDWTPPTGMTEGVDAASQARPSGVGISMEMAYATQAAAGATGAKSAAADGTGAAADVGVTHLLALAPYTVPTDFVVTMTGSTDNIVAGSVFLTGIATGAPEVTASSDNTGTNTITTNITTLTNNAWLVDIAACGNTGTYTAGGGQTERFDVAAASSSGALSTKPVATAGATSAGQTHTGANRLAHAVASFAPNGTIAYTSTASGSANGTNTLTWNHALPASPVGKLVVGISVEDPTCGGNQVVSSVTYAGSALTFITSRSTAAAGFCAHVELWYLDVF